MHTEELYVPYSLWTAAQVWASFASHALAGTLAKGSRSADAPCLAADLADKMLEEFKARFAQKK